MKTKITTGKVSATEDGAKAGRVTVELAEVDGSVYPDPFDPVFMSGWHWPPEPGDTVAAVTPDGEDAVEFADEVKWLGVVYDQENVAPKEFHDNHPRARGFKTKAGHLFVVDDKDKWISLKTPAGHELLLDEKQDKISFRYKNTDVITINASGIFFGTEGAAEPMVMGELWKAMQAEFMTAFLEHIHPTGVGPSGPPGGSTHAPNLTAAAPIEVSLPKVNAGDHLSDFINGQKAKP